MYITGIYMKTQYKSSITKNHKINFFFLLLMVFPEKATWPLNLFLDFAPEIKKSIVGQSSNK